MRRHRRLNAREMTAVMRTHDGQVTYSVANVSLGGALLVGGRTPMVQGTLDVELKLKGLRAVAVEAQVVHVRSGGVGISFAPKNGVEADAMQKLISAVESQLMQPPPLPAGRTRSTEEIPIAGRHDVEEAFFAGPEPRPPRGSDPDERAEYLRTLVKHREESIRRGKSTLAAVCEEAEQLRGVASRLKSRLDAAIAQQAALDATMAAAREAAAAQAEAQRFERETSGELIEQERQRTLEAIATVSALEAKMRRLEVEATKAREKTEAAVRAASAKAEGSATKALQAQLEQANRKAHEAAVAWQREHEARLAAEKTQVDLKAASTTADDYSRRLAGEVAKLKAKLVAAEAAIEQMARGRTARK